MSRLGQRVVACRKVWRFVPGLPIFGDAVDGPALIEFVRPDGIWAHDGDDPQACWRGVVNHGHIFPNMDDPLVQGHALALIAEHNARRSIFDALGDAYHKVGRGLSFPEALVELIEECEAAHGDG